MRARLSGWNVCVSCVVPVASALLASGCDGILGLDATTLAGDASSETDSVAPEGEAGGTMAASDASDASVAGDHAGADADASQPDVAVAEAEAAAPLFTTVPSSPSLKPGSSLPVTIDVARDGVLSGALSVTLTGLPSGVSCTTASIDADGGSAQVTVTAAGTVPAGVYSVGIRANGTTYGTVMLTIYGATGTPDSSFQGGYAIDSAAGASAVFNALAIDAMGRIVVGGGASAGGWILRRFLPDGTLDAAFNSATSATGALPTTGTLNGLAIDGTTGNIVCVGSVTGPQLSVTVITSAGNPSAAFNGGTPFSLMPVEAASSNGFGVVIDDAGTFSVAGTFNQGGAQAFLASGFAEASMPMWSGANEYDGPAKTNFQALTKDATGRHVAAGTNSSGQPSVILARLKGSTLDTTFMGNPILATTLTFQAVTVTVRPSSGQIFAGGFDTNSDMGGWAEWSPSGVLQWSKEVGMGGGGRFNWAGSAPLPGDTKDRIYVVGSGGDPNARSSYIDRINADGSLDTTFGTAGSVETSDPATDPSYWYVLQAVAVQADGLIVVAGQKATTSTPTYPFVGRFWP